MGFWMVWAARRAEGLAGLSVALGAWAALKAVWRPPSRRRPISRARVFYPGAEIAHKALSQLLAEGRRFAVIADGLGAGRFQLIHASFLSGLISAPAQLAPSDWLTRLDSVEVDAQRAY